MLEICTFPMLRPAPCPSDASTRICLRDVPVRLIWGVAAMLKMAILAVTLLFAELPPAAAWSFTDDGGRIVEIPDRVSRVLAAGPPAAVLIYVSAPDKLVGWVREPSAREKEFLLPAVQSLPTIGRLTGQGETANMEAVLAARPDIIIDVGTVDDRFVALADEIQQRTGIPYVLIDGSLANTPKSLRQVGKLLGVSSRADELAAYADRTLKRLDDGLAQIAMAERPRVYYGRGPQGVETGLAGSINLEILEAVGATNVAAAAGKGGLTRVSPQQIIDWNPQFILAYAPKFAQAVRVDRLWNQIAAVKDGNVYVTPTLPFGWFESPPGVNRLIGISWLEALFYPKAFQVDLKGDVQAFFKLFYQVELTDAQLDGLLKDALPKT